MRRLPTRMENEETSFAATSPQPPKVTKHITDDQECIENILLHLPAKSLLVSQTVCRGWRDMIQEPRFKKLHFEHNSRKSEPSQLLVLREIHEDGNIHDEVMVLDEVLQPSNIWMPQDLGGDWRFGGSCNGLLCIEVKRQIIVFNPVTREVVSLPKPTNIKGYGTEEIELMFTEFVFHRATGEYKVIIFYWNFSMTVGAAYMYVLGANSSWRYIGETDYFPRGSAHGVNVDDTVYWPHDHIMDGEADLFALSFDLNNEQIGKISLLEQDARNLAGLTTWDGKLCVASFTVEHQRLRISIYDNSNWTLRHVIQLPEIEGYFRPLAPYSSKSNRVFVWTYPDRIYYHDISGNPNNIQEIPVQHSREIKECFAYVESLLPVPK